MKKKTTTRLSRSDQKALTDLLSKQTTRIGTRRSENRGSSDTPIFTARNQSEMFVEKAKKPLFQLKSQLRIETVQDFIAANVHSQKINVKSWERFGDRNVSASAGFRLNWLRKIGLKLDVLAGEMNETFPNYDQGDLIEATVEFMRTYPEANDVRRYLDKRLDDQCSCQLPAKQKPNGKASPEEIRCFVEKARANLSDDVLNEETAIYLEAPKSYFGALFNIPDCSEDLFDLPEAETAKVIRAIQVSISQPSITKTFDKSMKKKDTSKAKVPAKRKAATPRKATTVSEAQKPDMARIKRVALAAKKDVAKKARAKKKTSPKKAVVATKKKAASVKAKRTEFSPAQKRQQAKIRQMNALAVQKVYDAGRRNTPKPSWKQANKAAAREVFK